MSSPDRLDELFRQLPKRSSPADLDAEIRRAAHGAVGPGDRAWLGTAARWASAAVVVLAVGVYLRLPQESRERGLDLPVQPATVQTTQAPSTPETALPAAKAADSAVDPGVVLVDERATAEFDDRSATAAAPATVAPQSRRHVPAIEEPLSRAVEALPPPPVEAAIESFNRDTRDEVGAAAQEELALELRVAPQVDAEPAVRQIEQPLLVTDEVADEVADAVADAVADPAASNPRVVADEPASRVVNPQQSVADSAAAADAVADSTSSASSDSSDSSESSELQEVVVTGSRRRGFLSRLFGRRRGSRQGMQTAAVEPPLSCVPGGHGVSRICTRAIEDDPQQPSREKQLYQVVPHRSVDCSQPFEFPGPVGLVFEYLDAKTRAGVENAATPAALVSWRWESETLELRCVAREWQLTRRESNAPD